MKRLFSIVVLGVFLVTGSAWAASFSSVETTLVLSAPVEKAPSIAKLETGDAIEVTHQAGEYWRVELPRGQTGYVPASSLQPTKIRGAFLAPLIIEAAPVITVVVTKIVNWFKKIFGIGRQAVDQADRTIAQGEELIVLAEEANGWLKVQTKDGEVGYVKGDSGLVRLEPVRYADTDTAGIWTGATPIPKNARSLTLYVEVRKADGMLVPRGGALRQGDEYRIYVTPSANCYVRITCETPDFRHVFGYYPNAYPGTQTSALFHAGRTYSTEILPVIDGVQRNLQVSEPIGSRDILRIEATTAGPFSYVPVPETGMPTATFRGGGFSSTGTVTNPTAQIVVEYPILTIR